MKNFFAAKMFLLFVQLAIRNSQTAYITMFPVYPVGKLVVPL